MEQSRPAHHDAPAGSGQLQIAVDIGGTFTDGVLLDDSSGAIAVAKSLTTPNDPGDGIAQVVRDLLAQAHLLAGASGHCDGSIRRVVHGTTLVANTLVERRGARAALVLTTGSADCLDIRRELRYDIYDLAAEYPVALIPASDRFELSARLGPLGETWRALDAGELDELAARVRAGGYEAVAVCLLHSPVDDAHEREVGRVLAQALGDDVPLTLSSSVAREIGEFERMSTAAANAYVQPMVAHYLSNLGQRLQTLKAGGTLDVMLSNGAFTRASLAAAAPIRILESGPAGGVLSAVNCGLVEGTDRVLAFDMGGTTAKACVSVAGKPSITHVFEFGRVQRFKRGSGLPAVAPSIDLIEIGAGGGSMASINALGLLQVGPHSAGSEPGPACYAQGGTNATVTDADLVLGYLDPYSFLGGRMRLDVELARAALARAGEPVGLNVEDTAWGIHDIVNENMAGAARTHIAEKGLDARDFTLVATGGAGPVHAVDVARRLRISRILCPIASGVGSCLGFLAAPARSDRSWSKVEILADLDTSDFDLRLSQARRDIVVDLAACGLAEHQIQWRLSVAARYAGQGNAVEVLVSTPDLTALDADGIAARFEAEYVRLYRKTVPGGVPELVTWRVSGSSPESIKRYHLAGEGQTATATDDAHERVERRVFLAGERRYAQVPVYARHAIAPGTELKAPLILTEPESTLVVAYAGQVRILETGTVEVTLDEYA